MKRCGSCKKELPLENFAKSSRHGYQSYCRGCNSSHKRIWIQNNRHRTVKNQLWSKYRLRPEQYDSLIERQNNRCGLCLKEFTETPHVDHDHNCCEGSVTCGSCVRGLLCSKCNKLLGGYEACIKMPTLVEYLAKSSKKS